MGAGRAEDQPGWGAVRRAGVFGGSFDPVHAGHLHVARAAAKAFGLERIVFVPAARPPHKPGRILSSAEDRLAMLALALRGEPAWSVSALELERPGPSYTYDTVRELPARLGLAPEAELHVLIGSDNLDGLERWHRAREMLERARPVAVHRGEEHAPVLARLRGSLGEVLYERIARGLLLEPPVRVSATELRERLRRGEDPGADLPPGVLEYIRRKGIYRAPQGHARPQP